MKKTGILNEPVSSLIASMGHTDSLCIADAGLPIPASTRRIDLAIRPGLPSFTEVLKSIVGDLVVEKAVVAREIRESNPAILEDIHSILGPDLPIEFVDHEELKKRSGGARAIVRTGECTPYANILLISGVAF